MNQVWVFTGASAGERFDWLSTCYNLTIVILAAICWVLNRREDGYMAQAYPDGSFAAHITGGWLARVSLRFGSPAALFAVVTCSGSPPAPPLLTATHWAGDRCPRLASRMDRTTQGNVWGVLWGETRHSRGVVELRRQFVAGSARPPDVRADKSHQPAKSV